MSKGGGSTTTQSQQKSEPWGPAQPLLKGALSDAQRWYSSPYGTNPYPGSTVVPYSPYTEQALGMTANRAMQGSPLQGAANQTLQNTIQGNYLSGATNPWLSQTYDLAAGKVRSSLDSQFNKNGTYGSTLHQGAMGDAMNNLATSIYGGNYQMERGNQMNAMGLAPGFAATDYLDAANLGQVGQAYENQAGKNLQEQVNRYDFYNQQPYNRLQQLVNLAQPVGASGGLQTGTQTTPTQSNGASNILGSLASIASIGASLSNPEFKENIREFKDEDVLAAMREVPGYSYTYKTYLGEAFAGNKIGPMADDWARHFGGSGKVIPMPEMIGAMWTAISALSRAVEDLKRRLDQ